jgi:hypothetical protein
VFLNKIDSQIRDDAMTQVLERACMEPPPYNVVMARGWESKSVEAQQAEASEEKQRSGPRMSPEQAARQRQVEGLGLSRQRVLQQAEAARDPRHRQMLEKALADLDRQIEALKSP